MGHVPGKSPFGDKQSSSSLVFEEFVPPSAWTEDSTCHYLLVDLPGFKRQELKLQVDKQAHMLVSGERHVRENKYKRFEQSFKLPKDADIEKISGKLEGEILYISVPKKVESQEHGQEIKHDNIPEPISDEDQSKSDTSESDNKDDEIKSDADVNEDESENKEGKKDLERKKHKMGIDENWGQEADLYLRLAIEKLRKNKGIVVTAIFAFSLGVLVTQKFQSDGH